jgi:predicted DNA-binding transcriptional regulator YafY
LVRYQSFKYPSPIEICFHPWHLRQYNHRWFAFGYNPSQPELPFMTLPLDRIKDISPHNNHYIQNNDVDFEEWFEDMIGVTRTVNSKIEKVTLQFSSERAPYVLTKPLHGSQKKLKHDKWGLIISLEVIVNLELFQTIFSFGADVIVLAPKSVREAVVNNISSSLEKYAT